MMLWFGIFFVLLHIATGASKEFMMFVADGNQINTLNSSGKVILSSHFNSTVGSIAVDTNGTDALGHFRILYSLYDNDSVIYSQDVEKSKAIQRFIGFAVHQLARDPVSENIFYRGYNLSTYNMHIGVIFPDGSHIKIITEMRYSCCFILHPWRRQLFWTDAGFNNFIGTIDMDNVRPTSEHRGSVWSSLQHPYAIAIDFNADMLYCGDSYVGKIVRSNMTGGVSEIFLETRHVVDYIVIDGDFLYYTSVRDLFIRKVSLSHPSDRSIFGSFSESSGRSLGYEPIKGLPFDSVSDGGLFTSIAIGSKDTWKQYTHDFTLFVADKDKKCIYRMNSSAEVTDTYNFDSKVGSLTVDAYSSKPADRPSILYGINRRNNSGLMYRQNFAGSAPELIASFPGVAVDDIAVDPTSGNIYYRGFFKDNYTSYVGIIYPDGHRIKIISGLESACCLILHPQKGLIFWTEDEYLSNKYIGVANMDGSNVKRVISENLQHPLAIAIDYTDDLLYWADWVSGKIERCDLSGGARETFLETGHEIDYMVIYREFLYYTSVGESVIRRVSIKDVSDNSTFGVLPTGGYFISLDIYSVDKMNQPKNSDCSNRQGHGDCNYICLPTANGHVCKCPVGFQLHTDGKTCKTETGPYLNNGANGVSSMEKHFIHFTASIQILMLLYKNNVF